MDCWSETYRIVINSTKSGLFVILLVGVKFHVYFNCIGNRNEDKAARVIWQESHGVNDGCS